MKMPGWLKTVGVKTKVAAFGVAAGLGTGAVEAVRTHLASGGNPLDWQGLISIAAAGAVTGAVGYVMHSPRQPQIDKIDPSKLTPEQLAKLQEILRQQ